MNMNLYPLMFKPVYKDYPWGGSRIPETFNRNLSTGIYAESWEITDHNDGMSIVENGPYTGESFRSLLKQAPQAIISNRSKHDAFPLLIKLIDASKKLSVQVHPNDLTAAQYGGEPKTEMWYLLGDNKTAVYCGLQPNTTQHQFLAAVENNTSEELLQRIPVQKESAIFVRGGRVHAIDSGCLILEIQQSSNTTYRIYDWGRMGNDGKPRELHIEKAVEVINWDDTENPLVEPICLSQTDTLEHWQILACDYFKLDKWILNGNHVCTLDGSTFNALFIAEGQITLTWGSDNSLTVPTGRSVLIPAGLSSYTLTGTGTILRTALP
ncbi:MAG: mannose-6-phosphate isomerase [Kiritimatiellaceae bacterium]|nr:mannose-6-phosphate isomerase [Kiritimatiellaceae bacterium]